MFAWHGFALLLMLVTYMQVNIFKIVFLLKYSFKFYSFEV